MKHNYLLIDYENVQPENMELLNGTAFRVLVFLGAHQTKVPVEFAKALQKLGSAAEYIQICGKGPNAVDFHIAFTIGALSSVDPGAHFYIISRDAGFDPLIDHAKKKGLRVTRKPDLSEIRILTLTNTSKPSEKVAAIVRNLTSRGTSLPRTVTTLRNSINALFRKTLDEAELEHLVKSLKKKGYISIEGEHVTYQLKSEP